MLVAYGLGIAGSSRVVESGDTEVGESGDTEVVERVGSAFEHVYGK